MKKTFKPGQTADKSGQYDMLGPKGGFVKEVTIIKGKPFPPTEKPNSGYKIADPTKNKSGK
jgi:hypothetical protein